MAPIKYHPILEKNQLEKRSSSSPGSSTLPGRSQLFGAANLLLFAGGHIGADG